LGRGDRAVPAIGDRVSLEVLVEAVPMDIGATVYDVTSDEVWVEIDPVDTGHVRHVDEVRTDRLVDLSGELPRLRIASSGRADGEFEDPLKAL
jgi:hypothetical protein